VSYPFTLSVVMLAVYGLLSLLFAAVVAITSLFDLWEWPSTSREILSIRLLPSAGALSITLTVVLPAFLKYEPAHELEDVGPLLVALALIALAAIADGVRRGWRGWLTSRMFLRHCHPIADSYVTREGKVNIVELAAPIVTVVGSWRHEIVAAKRVVAACSSEEFRQIIAHEAAHVSARDNLKLILLVASPDVLAWLPIGAALIQRWRAAAEVEADEHATGSDPHKRLALASALIKVARLSTGDNCERAGLSMEIAVDSIEFRVRRLLAAPKVLRRTLTIQTIAVCTPLFAMAAVPLYALVYHLTEALVVIGR
jgi:Zn-dependent protease with chaperone function